MLRIGVLQRCPSTMPRLPGELLRGCLVGDRRRAVDEARRLVEGEGVDVILAYPGDHEGYALALYVRSQPDKTLVLGSSAFQGTTLDVGAPNIFRYVPDSGQRAAGLGAYAWHRLGWRSASVSRDRTQLALEQAHAFAAEFCALGGELVLDGGDGVFVSRGGRASLGTDVRTAAQGRDALAALRRALRVTRGDLADGHRRLRDELRLGLDENGQVVADVRLLREGRTLSRLAGVEQTFGGAFDGETSPPEGEPECERRDPPPWAATP